MSILKTPLYDWHLSQKAYLVPFANTWLPLRYSSEREEHLAVRNHVGIFDVSHMGEIFVEGPGAVDFLPKLLTRNVCKLKPYQAQYCLMLNEQGGIIDDLIVYRLEEHRFLLCVNAANIEKDWQWINAQAQHQKNLQLLDGSNDYGQIALQGPKALALLAELGMSKAPKRFFCHNQRIGGTECLIARTGYTGEDGVEIFVNSAQTSTLWQEIFSIGKNFDLSPCGLAARDSLRLEAGLLLHGTDMDEQTSPLEAKLNFALDLSGIDFIGKKALEQEIERGSKRKLVGFCLKERGLARAGLKILDTQNNVIGKVSSGSWPPTQRNAIGLAYVESSFDDENISIDIRNKAVPARITGTKFC